MAVSTSSKFSNAIVSSLTKGNIFRHDTKPTLPVGTKLETHDGRKFRYSHFGAAVNAGVLVSQDLSESSLVDTDNSVIASASSVNTSDGKIGSYAFQLTLASVTANQYAGATLHITDDAGEGHTYRIKGNDATDATATGDTRITLYDPLQVALTTTSDVAIFGSMYANLELATEGTDVAVAGVSCATMLINEFGFIQTAGPATILTDGTIAVGDIVTLSDGVAGAVHVAGGGGATAGGTDVIAESLVGYCVIAGDTSGHGVYILQLAD